MQDKKEYNILVGKRIKTAREAAGLTQERFAELLPMSVKNISAIERGAVGISLQALERICTVLSISSDTILFEQKASNDVDVLTDRLSRLSPKQFEITKEIINKVIESFHCQ